ncbi:MAG: hypothetical protein AB7Q42_15435 [Acidimicrobiia bacterium]
MSRNHPSDGTIGRARHLAGAAVVLALGLGAAACSDVEKADDVPAAACDAFVGVSAIFTGDPSSAGAVLESFVGALPEDLRDDGEAVSNGLQAAFAGDEAAMSSPEYVDANTAIGEAMYEGCDTAQKLDVAGIDYGFEGLPDSVKAGRVAIQFTNKTKNDEAHEMFIVVRNEGTTETFEELDALPEEELFSKVTPVGVVFADQADGVATTLLDLQPGSYIAVCNIPVGGGETGDPHALHGMVAEFDVA